MTTDYKVIMSQTKTEHKKKKKRKTEINTNNKHMHAQDFKMRPHQIDCLVLDVSLEKDIYEQAISSSLKLF